MRLVRRFFHQMDTRPEAAVIRAMHQDDLESMVDRLSTFLIAWMGGAQRYRERFGPTIIPLAHQRFAIGPAERDEWLECMRLALEDVGAEKSLSEQLMPAFYQMADMCRTDPESGDF